MTLQEKLSLVQKILHRAVPRSWYDDPAPSFAMRAKYKSCFKVETFKVKVSNTGPDNIRCLYLAVWDIVNLCRLKEKDLLLLIDTLDELDKIKQLPKLKEENNE